MSRRYHARSARFSRGSTFQFANRHTGGPKLPWCPPHRDQEQAPASRHLTERGRCSRLGKVGRAKRRQGQRGEAIFPTTLRDRQEGWRRPVCPAYRGRRRSDLNALHTIGRGLTDPCYLALALARLPVHRLLRIGGRGSCEQLRRTRNLRLPYLTNSLRSSLP